MSCLLRQFCFARDLFYTNHTTNKPRSRRLSQQHTTFLNTSARHPQNNSQIDFKMTEFLDWKALSKEQYHVLEQIIDPIDLRHQLIRFLNIRHDDPRKTEIQADFHVFNYTFCKDQAFDGRRTSTFVSIMNEIFLTDTSTHDPARSREASYLHFQNLLMKHSVERPPINIQVFTEKDLELILKYAVDSYFRQFNLYKYIFSPRLRLIAKQVMPQDVEQPSLPIVSLNSGMKLMTETILEDHVGQVEEEKH